MQQLFRVAHDAGLPTDKLHSHQILPRANSTWNPALFATDAGTAAGLPWRPGLNTYGGTTDGPWIRKLLQAGPVAPYGVPEFHPQQWKRAEAPRQALELHQRLGAHFVSPYFISLISDREAKLDAAVSKLEIRANNPMEGSDNLYAAIRLLAKQ